MTTIRSTTRIETSSAAKGRRQRRKANGPRAVHGRRRGLAEQVRQGEVAEYLIDGRLNGLPHRTDRTTGIVGADLLDAGMALAEHRVVQPAPQGGEDLANRHVVGRTGERVAAVLAAR